MKANLFLDYRQVKGKNFKVLFDECFWFARKSKKFARNLNNSDIEYFWDNNNIKENDLKKIEKLKKQYFIFLVKNLNKYHSKKLPYAFWKIVLYPWLDAIIPKIFHLWKITYNLKKNLYCNINSYKAESFIPNNFQDLYYYENLDFNRWIASECIVFQKRLKFKRNKKIFLTKINSQKKRESLFFKFYILLSKVMSKFFECRYMIYNIQISNIDFLLLNLRLGQFPFLWSLNENISEKINLANRENLFKIKVRDKSFYTFIKKITPYILPKNYFENYQKINNKINKSYWPNKTKISITSISYWFDDFYKFWIANQKIKNSKYFILQHGGRMGLEKVITNLSTQIEISDKFLSWGWSNKNKKIIPFHSILLSRINDKSKYKYNDKIYFCQHLYPHFFNHIDGSPILFKDKIFYTEICNKVYKELNSKIKSCFNVRYLHDFVYEYRPYHSFFLNSKIKKDPAIKNFHSIIKESKLIIHDQDSTSFLETLSANIPTCLILKKDYIKYKRTEIKKFYSALEKQNIIFTDTLKLANFINLNYHTIDKWWSLNKTQNAKDKFCKNFANKSKNSLRELSNLLKKYST